MIAGDDFGLVRYGFRCVLRAHISPVPRYVIRVRRVSTAFVYGVRASFTAFELRLRVRVRRFLRAPLAAFVYGVRVRFWDQHP